jgi:hypothetical protein
MWSGTTGRLTARSAAENLFETRWRLLLPRFETDRLLRFETYRFDDWLWERETEVFLFLAFASTCKAQGQATQMMSRAAAISLG